MTQSSYFTAANPDVRASGVALAKRYSELANAVRDMGRGVVFDESREIVAFHERHLELLTRRGSLRMTGVK